MSGILNYEGPVVAHPKTPHTLQETGLSFDMVEQLTLKMLHFSGELSGGDLAHRLRLQYSALTPVLEHLKQL